MQNLPFSCVDTRGNDAVSTQEISRKMSPGNDYPVTREMEDSTIPIGRSADDTQDRSRIGSRIFEIHRNYRKIHKNTPPAMFCVSFYSSILFVFVLFSYTPIKNVHTT
eukprot:GEMP01069488.1.p1 GENE.GEMP01069488.1~~GEMP01069488.1.p1  ORF type:complete len:108 (-),score=4.30 GEMP01069488.1:323-646(-)